MDQEKKDDVSYDESPDGAAYVLDEESALGRALDGASAAVEQAVAHVRLSIRQTRSAVWHPVP